MLLAIADHSNDDGVCWPSVERLANKCRITKRHTKRVIQQLKEDGEIALDIGGGRGRTTLYTVILDKGDVDVTVSEEQEKKGDIPAQKGDVGVTDSPKRVTSRVIKGDVGVTQNHKEPSIKDNHQEPSRPPPILDPEELDAMSQAILKVIKPVHNQQEQETLREVVKSFVETGIDVEQVQAFLDWWRAFGLYNGPVHMAKPSLDIFAKKFLQYLEEMEIYA